MPRIATAVFCIAARPDGRASAKSIIHGVRHQMRHAAVLSRVLATFVVSRRSRRSASRARRRRRASTSPGSTTIPPIVEQAIAEKKLPGAVVLVGRGDRVVYQKAIGRRAVEPAPEAMTLDTIFDVASLTKVVATTTSVMKLVEDGRVRLTDRVSDYIPGFERYNKANITVRHLMAHTSGPASRRRSRRHVDRLRQGDRAGDRRDPDGAAGRALRLQRHQLLPARRHREAGQRPAARSSSRRSTSSIRSG